MEMYKETKTKLAKHYLHKEQEHMLVITPSGTKNYFHVIFDSAYQDNSYDHMTAEQIWEKYKIIPAIIQKINTI